MIKADACDTRPPNPANTYLQNRRVKTAIAPSARLDVSSPPQPFGWYPTIPDPVMISWCATKPQSITPVSTVRMIKRTLKRLDAKFSKVSNVLIHHPKINSNKYDT